MATENTQIAPAYSSAIEDSQSCWVVSFWRQPLDFVFFFLLGPEWLVKCRKLRSNCPRAHWPNPIRLTTSNHWLYFKVVFIGIQMHQKVFIRSSSEGGAGPCNSPVRIVLIVMKQSHYPLWRGRILHRKCSGFHVSAYWLRGRDVCVLPVYALTGDGYVPWQGIKLPTFWCMGEHSNLLSISSRG